MLPRDNLSCQNEWSGYHFFENNIIGKQGYLLSATVFQVFSNGLPVELKACGIGFSFYGISLILHSYADVVIFANTENELQRYIDLIYNWCKKWRLSINIDKSEIIIINRRCI